MAVTGVASSAGFSASVSVQVAQIRVEILPPATQTSVSPAGGLLGQLDALSKGDPARFKAVMGDVSRRLAEQAAQVGGGRGEVLQDLSARFGAAASGGDLAAIFRTPPGVATPAAGDSATADPASPGATAGAPPAQGDQGERVHHHHHRHRHGHHRGWGEDEGGGPLFGVLVDAIRGALSSVPAAGAAAPPAVAA
jgi:hypothetical protein